MASRHFCTTAATTTTTTTTTTTADEIDDAAKVLSEKSYPFEITRLDLLRLWQAPHPASSPGAQGDQHDAEDGCVHGLRSSEIACSSSQPGHCQHGFQECRAACRIHCHECGHQSHDPFGASIPDHGRVQCFCQVQPWQGCGPLHDVHGKCGGCQGSLPGIDGLQGCGQGVPALSLLVILLNRTCAIRVA